jgi:hypothetical protein
MKRIGIPPCLVANQGSLPYLGRIVKRRMASLRRVGAELGYVSARAASSEGAARTPSLWPILVYVAEIDAVIATFRSALDKKVQPTDDEVSIPLKDEML